MTKTKTMLVVSLAAVFTISMITSAYAVANPIGTAVTVSQKGTFTVNITTDTPATTGDPGVDYGFAVPGEKGLLVITTHPDATDSVAQPPTEAFHTHVVTLEGTDQCANNVAVKTATKNEVGHLSIDGTNISVTNIPSGLTGQLAENVVSFDLTLENGRVCVNITNVA